MKIEERYIKLQEIKKRLDEQLKHLSFDKIKEMILETQKNPLFQKLKYEDGQLIMLDSFYTIWIAEKKQLEKLGIKEDIFTDINSLSDVERKYLSTKYCVLRIENQVPYEQCLAAVEGLVNMNISGIAIGHIVENESRERIENIIALSRMLKNMGQTIRALHLLQYADSRYENQEEILIELADCWLEGQQWGAALDCLQRIENPPKDVCDLIKELENVISV